MTPLIALLLDALAAGQVAVRYGRIEGRAGWLNARTRVVTLDPRATPEELEAELLHDLTGLLEQSSPTPRPPPLQLLHGGLDNGDDLDHVDSQVAE